MKILVTAIHYPVASARYAVDALRRLGHSVHSAGPAAGRAIWGIRVPPHYAWEPDPPPPGWEPNLALHMDAHLPAARHHNCPHVVFGVDNHVCGYHQLAWDHLFLAHGGGLRMGEPEVTWLPCAYDPVHFTPGPPYAARALDAALVGVGYPARGALIEALRAALPDLRLFAGTGLLYDGYAGVYHAARISLVRSVAGDVAQRAWETAAMGCLLVLDEVHDCAALGLRHGENCLLYRSEAGAVDRVRWALDHPVAAAEIAAAGQRWAAPGTWDARLAVIVDWVEADAR